MRQNIREEILVTAQRMFFTMGYRKVTIDSLAASMKISKKTVYKNFRSKKELLVETFEMYREDIGRDLNRILERDDLPYPEKLKQVLSCIGVYLGSMNNVLFRDIRELAPELWGKIRSYKHEAAYLRFNRLIEEGRRNGHIKKDINRAVIVALYASAIENLLDPSFMSQLPGELSREIPVKPVEVFDNTIRIIYEGILTPEIRATFLDEG